MHAFQQLICLISANRHSACKLRRTARYSALVYIFSKHCIKFWRQCTRDRCTDIDIVWTVAEAECTNQNECTYAAWCAVSWNLNAQCRIAEIVQSHCWNECTISKIDCKMVENLTSFARWVTLHTQNQGCGFLSLCGCLGTHDKRCSKCIQWHNTFSYA